LDIGILFRGVDPKKVYWTGFASTFSFVKITARHISLNR